MSTSSQPPNPNPPGYRWDSEQGQWITEEQWQMKQFDRREQVSQHWAVRRMAAMIAVAVGTLTFWAIEPDLIEHEGIIYCASGAFLIFLIARYGRRQ